MSHTPSPSPPEAPPTTLSAKIGRWKYVWVVLLVTGFILWSGLNRSLPDLTTELVLQGEVSTQSIESPTLKVASFNIHGGVGNDGIKDLARTANLLKGFDLVGMYEVHSQQMGFGDNIAHVIGQKLNMASTFSATEQRWWHDHFGNALLTKTALLKLQRLPLPGTQKKRFRSMILSSFLFQGKRVNIICVHIDRVKDREIQLQKVIQLFLSLDEPTILMGDFNSNAKDPQMVRLLKEPGVVDCVGETAGENKPYHVDWIITRGFHCKDAKLVENDVSDHHLVWAELELLDK